MRCELEEINQSYSNPLSPFSLTPPSSSPPMRLALLSLTVLCALTTTVATDSITDPADLDAIPYNITRRRVQRKDHDTENALAAAGSENSTVKSGKSSNGYGRGETGEQLMSIPTTTTTTTSEEVIVVEEPTSSKVKTLIYFLLIVIGGVGVGMVAILLCCCWIEKRRLRRLATEMSDRPDEMGVHPVSRPLILENNGDAEVPFDPPSPGVRPVIERVLPDPFSPVQYISTPINMESEAQLTNTEIVTPIEKKPFLRGDLPVATPAKDEKVPELHVDEYK